MRLAYLYVLVEPCSLLVRSYEEIDEECDKCKRKDKSYDVNVSCEQAAELIDDERYCVCKSALIADCEPSPLRAVHLTSDSTDSCEAGSTEEIESKE